MTVDQADGATGEFECAYCQSVSDEQPIVCASCGELKCELCVPGGMGTWCLACEERTLELSTPLGVDERELSNILRFCRPHALD